MSRRAVACARAACSLTMVGLLLGLGEGAARWFEWGDRRAADRITAQVFLNDTPLPLLTFAAPGLIVVDAQVGYRLRPGATVRDRQWTVTYQINSHGFRGEDVGMTKAPGDFRILATGGSTTFGFGVEEHETYPYALETLLNARCPRPAPSRFEVMNVGVPGYVSAQNLRRFEEEWAAYQPDMVIGMEGLNDFAVVFTQPAAPCAHTSSSTLVPGRSREALLWFYRWIIPRSALVRVLDRFVWWGRTRHADARCASQPPSDPHVTDRPVAAWSTPVMRVLEENLDHLYRSTTRRRATLVLVGYPGMLNDRLSAMLEELPHQLRPNRRIHFKAGGFEPVVDFMGEWAESRGVRFVDLRVEMRQEPRKSALYLSDGMHFTGRGNAWVAEQIFREIFSDSCQAVRTGA